MKKLTLQELFRDCRRLYWPIEAYVHARAIYGKQYLIDGTWSTLTTWSLVDGTGNRLRLPQ